MSELSTSSQVPTFSEKYDEVASFVDYSLSLAQGISENGGETKDIEQAVIDICTAYGAKKVNVCAIPSLIEVTVTMPDGFKMSLSRRIYHDETNLFRLEKFDQLIDTVEKSTPNAETRNDMLKVAHHQCT